MRSDAHVTHEIEAKMLYLDFIFLKSAEKKLIEENAELQKRLAAYERVEKPQEAVACVEMTSCAAKPKRIRKTKEEVARDFSCAIGGCDKAYG